MPAEKVSHVINSGLEKGARYKVFVTQINSYRKESPLSAPAYITIGEGNSTVVVDTERR